MLQASPTSTGSTTLSASTDATTAATRVHQHLRIAPPPPRDADVTDLEQVRADRRAAAQQRRAAARTRDLAALLGERPDLVGVHAPADLAIDLARWCV